jgi:uncharacterized protein
MVNSALAVRLNDDLKNAMKAGDKVQLDTVRMLKAGLQKILIEKQDKFTPDDELAFLQIETKRRKEAIEQYIKGNRRDLADKETKELEIIARYMPAPLSESELNNIIETSIKESGAQTMKDIGKLMSVLIPRIKGRADGKKVQEIVKNKLQG